MTDRPKRRLSPRQRPRLALGTLAAASLGLAGCTDPYDGEYAFASVRECVNEGFDVAVCEGEFQSALTDHVSGAPRFVTVGECAAVFGEERCVATEEPTRSASGAQSVFMPFLAGYLVANALRPVRSFGEYQAYRAANPGYASGPVYRDGANRPVTMVRGANGLRTIRAIDPAPRTVARGGFGQRGARRGYGG